MRFIPVLLPSLALCLPTVNATAKWKVLGVFLTLLMLSQAVMAQVPTPSSPISATAVIPQSLVQGTVITLPSGQMWVVAGGYNTNFVTAAQTVILTAATDGTYRLSLQAGTSIAVIPLPDTSPTVTTAVVPQSLVEGTVVTLANGQRWVVTGGYNTNFVTSSQTVIVYRYTDGTYRLSTSAGTSVAVIPMPDTSPTVTTAVVPQSLVEGTVITLAWISTDRNRPKN